MAVMFINGCGTYFFFQGLFAEITDESGAGYLNWEPMMIGEGKVASV